MGSETLTAIGQILLACVGIGGYVGWSRRKTKAEAENVAVASAGEVALLWKDYAREQTDQKHILEKRIDKLEEANRLLTEQMLADRQRCDQLEAALRKAGIVVE